MGEALLVALVTVATALLAAALVPVSRALALRYGVIDEPGGRKRHRAPTPRLGGLAVFVSFLAVVLGGYFFLGTLREMPLVRASLGSAIDLLRDARKVEAKLVALACGSSIAFAVGLLDDVFGHRFHVAAKAGGQVFAAALAIGADVRVSFLPYDWMNDGVTLVWLVGMTNAFNLLDNMDGLSAGVALVASTVFLLNAWALGEFFISLILAAFIGSLLGFLLFNFPPASVFLGDCGSLLIGYVMGSLTLLERYVSHASSSLFPVLMPVVVLAVPLVDTATVVVIRLREKRPIYVGDSRHLSHRLASLGFSPKATALFIYLVTFCLGLGATNLSDATLGQSLIILLQSACIVALILILMFLPERDPGTAP